MSKVTVGDLKQYLEELLNDLEEFDDDMEIPTTTNTYFIHSSYFMQYGRAGFIDLSSLYDNLSEQDEESEDGDDDDTENSEE